MVSRTPQFRYRKMFRSKGRTAAAQAIRVTRAHARRAILDAGLRRTNWLDDLCWSAAWILHLGRVWVWVAHKT